MPEPTLVIRGGSVVGPAGVVPGDIAIAGTEIIIDGGKLRDVHEVGLAPGTQITYAATLTGSTMVVSPSVATAITRPERAVTSWILERVFS